MAKFKKTANKNNFSNNNPITKYSMLHFGKYKGRTCEGVAYKDPDYMDWLSKEPTVQFDNDLMVLVEECLSWKNNWDSEEYEKEMQKVSNNPFIESYWNILETTL